MLENDLIKLICENFEREFSLNTAENYTKVLTGEPFKLNPSELLYLFLSVEKIYNIKIEKEDIISHKFNTIEGIAQIIQKEN